MKKKIKYHTELGGYIYRDSYWGSGSSGSWPFAKLEIKKDRVIITYFFINIIEFKKRNIIRIRSVPFQGGLIQLCHKEKNVMSYVAFHSFRWRRLLDKFKEVGYKVE